MLGSFSVAAWVALSVAAAPEGGRPWENATPEQEKAAKVLFDKGVLELFSLRFGDAAQDFREAIKLWDLPVFHRNLAAALRGLTDFVGAREQLLIALQYGPEGMADENEFEKAQEDLVTVEAELSRLVITCDQEGAKVSIDGPKDLFACPRTQEVWIHPGPHSIRIRIDQQGYSRPYVEKRTLMKGEKVALHLKARSDEELMESPWPGWIPWTAVVAGVAIGAGGGGLLHYQARLSFRAYDDGIRTCADSQPAGARYICPANETALLVPLQESGNRWQAGAIASYVGGGVVLVTGAALLYINRPRLPPIPEGVAVVPVLAPGSAGVAMAFDF